MVTLATQLRHATGGDVRFSTVPIADPSFRAGSAGAVALWDEAGAKALFDGMRSDAAPAKRARQPAAARLGVPPDQVRVQVYNGSGIVGLGTRAGHALTGIGFVSAGPAQNWRTNDVTQTLLRYDTRYTESIKTLSAAVPGARLVPVPGLGRTLQVVTGSTFTGVHAVRVASATPAGTPAERTASADPCA